jgi:hypothetical protein
MKPRELTSREMCAVRGGGDPIVVTAVCPLDHTSYFDPNHTSAHFEQLVVCDLGTIFRPQELYTPVRF